MARSSTSFLQKWKSKTSVIRVPENLARLVSDLALAAEGDSAIRLELEALVPQRIKKVQYSVERQVNVSSVPQRSPFRYPGGKTWLIPYIRDWFLSFSRKPTRLIEPFAGGAVVSLTAGFEGLARHVIFCESDPDVAAVWRVVLNGQSEWLCDKILSFNVTEATVRKEIARVPAELRERAFQTILRNRVQRGGILAPGAGLIRTGENDRGLKARWYPETLARRLSEINARKDKFTFIQGDAFETIKEYQADPNAVFYFDPPYMKAAKRLYRNWDIDHERLFQMASACKGNFLMSYDDTPEIRNMADKYGFVWRNISMKSTHHAKKMELLISKHLRWLPVTGSAEPQRAYEKPSV